MASFQLVERLPAIKTACSYSAVSIIAVCHNILPYMSLLMHSQKRLTEIQETVLQALPAVRPRLVLGCQRSCRSASQCISKAQLCHVSRSVYLQSPKT